MVLLIAFRLSTNETYFWLWEKFSTFVHLTFTRNCLALKIIIYFSRKVFYIPFSKTIANYIIKYMTSCLSNHTEDFFLLTKPTSSWLVNLLLKFLKLLQWFNQSIWKAKQIYFYSLLFSVLSLCLCSW